MYCFSASPTAFPLFLFHASHLARAMESPAAGSAMLQSPTVTCLYKPYSSSMTLSSGLVVSALTLAAALLNSSDGILELKKENCQLPVDDATECKITYIYDCTLSNFCCLYIKYLILISVCDFCVCHILMDSFHL